MGTIAHKDAATMSIPHKVKEAEWKATTTHVDSQGNPVELSRSATFVVAASNASSASKAGADYVLDESNINDAITALPALGGKIKLSEGTFTIKNDILVNKDYVDIEGCGISTTLIADAAWAGTNLINISKSYCRISNMNLDGATLIDTGIYIAADQTNNIIKDCLISRFNTAAVDMVAGTGGAHKVINSIIRACKTGIILAANDCDVIDTEIGWATGCEIGIDCVAATIRLLGNMIWQPTIACIRIKYGDIEIANSILSESDLNGILIDTDLSGADVSRLRIHDNWIRQQAEGGGDYDCIRVTGTHRLINSVIKANIFGYPTKLQRYCIRGAIDNSIIEGNDFQDGYATSPLLITGYNTIKNNNGLNLRDEMELNAFVKNVSGGQLDAGDVVISAHPEDGNFWQVTTTTTQGDNKVIGVMAETVVNNGVGRMVTRGKIVTLKVDGTTDIAVNDLLATFTTAKIACKAAVGDTAFAIALEDYATDDSNGVIDALLIIPSRI